MPSLRKCILPGCNNIKNSSFSLFQFPKNVDVRNKWIHFGNRHLDGELTILTNTRLCRDHLTPDNVTNCYQRQLGFTDSPLLLLNAAEPTIFRPGLHPTLPPKSGATVGSACPPMSRKAVSPERPPLKERPLLEFPSFEESETSINMADHDVSTYLPSMFELVDTTREQVCKAVTFINGTFLSVTQKCLHRSCLFTREWKSQPLLGSTPAGNLDLSAAVYHTGSSFIQTNKYERPEESDAIACDMSRFSCTGRVGTPGDPTSQSLS
ncbi:hypothetical protein E1301_Tti016557 [Triplophysa tibetana]|uniref:THAP domain-containing protein 1 n=1 Tax=Triplophysa tibetana TaxID=1572043 RepID=A0A5A9N184_9TELE|nr:hypothetical protein E1301_Tti016557 [Triplophysa tibetana]